MWLVWIVWEGGEGVCEVAYSWSEAIANPLGMFSSDKRSSFPEKNRISFNCGLNNDQFCDLCVTMDSAFIQHFRDSFHDSVIAEIIRAYFYQKVV